MSKAELQKEIDELRARVKLQDDVIAKLVGLPTYSPWPYVPVQPTWVQPTWVQPTWVPWVQPNIQPLPWYDPQKVTCNADCMPYTGSG
jgi:hypothetical protein